MQRRYRVVLEEDNEEGGYIVTVPGLPGCITEGDTVEEAMSNAREAIIGYLEALKKEGFPLPPDNPLFIFGEVEVAI
jgi:predicted RNase H-like HicB family nuclease